MKTQYTLWFNPKCSKCRETLELLRKRNVEPLIRRYLEQQPTRDEVEALIQGLGAVPHDLLRTKEEAYKALRLSPESTRDTIVEALVAHPELLERPVLVRGDRAVIARPPERALELLP
jgi:arsenate reductase (glutaredoxin)